MYLPSTSCSTFENGTKPVWHGSEVASVNTLVIIEYYEGKFEIFESSYFMVYITPIILAHPDVYVNSANVNSK